VRLAREHRAAFEGHRRRFRAELEQRMGQWTKTLAPVRGSKVVVFHPVFVYFLTRFGLVQAGAVEDRPGIPPSPQHVVNLIRQMKEEKIKVVLVEPWNDVKLANRVAEEAGARALVMASGVGAVKGTDTYFAAIDYNVSTLARALAP
jgi:ABC-type Zn uptake system ZnuABC Zn-binding protein ZnuA